MCWKAVTLKELALSDINQPMIERLAGFTVHTAPPK